MTQGFRNHISSFTLFIVLSVITGACVSSYNTISNREFTNQYNPNDTPLNIKYNIYMKSAGEYRLYYKIFPNQLTYTQLEDDSIPLAGASIFYRITENYSSVNILDSLTQGFRFKNYQQNQYMGYLPINITEPGNYVMEVFYTDLISNNTVNEIIDLDFSLKGNENSFFFTNLYGSPIFNTYTTTKDTFRLGSHYYQGLPIQASYYKSEELLPLPPDVIKIIPYPEPVVDSSFTIALMDTTLLHSNKSGVCYVSPNEETKGKAIGIFHEHYPFIKTPEQLLKPLAYLCGPKEMEGYWNSPELKYAVDSFWLRSADDLEKARELIRVYYNRVQMANYYFSDYREGWKTDRGMVYTVCGLPASIKKSEIAEIWIYGSQEQLQFTFYKEEHPKFGQIFELNRSEKYAGIWFNAIGSWRDGRIFSLNPL